MEENDSFNTYYYRKSNICIDVHQYFAILRQQLKIMVQILAFIQIKIRQGKYADILWINWTGGISVMRTAWTWCLWTLEAHSKEDIITVLT